MRLYKLRLAAYSCSSFAGSAALVALFQAANAASSSAAWASRGTVGAAADADALAATALAEGAPRGRVAGVCRGSLHAPKANTATAKHALCVLRAPRASDRHPPRRSSTIGPIYIGWSG